MREIKFRAWDTQNERMVDLKKITPLALTAGLDIDGIFIPFTDDLKLMQFTGLHDKNGKEIYEGDIVRWSDNFERRVFCYESAVHWGQGGWDILGGEVQGDRIVELLGEVIKDEQENIEVIGNIYENGDLLA